jgi:DNA-3-methyladenine glycosylase
VLPRDFYAQRALPVARALIGMHLVHLEAGVRRVGRIVETEAYLGPADLAAHSARGRTARTEVIFGPPGFAYVYLIYGMWNCLNVVVRPAGVPHAVLLRALEPVENVDARTWGPGLLTRAMGIDRRQNGADLCGAVAGGSGLWIERPVQAAELAPAKAPTACARGNARGRARLSATRSGGPRVGRATRIGVDYAGEWAARAWRFFDRDSPWVSTATAAQRADRRPRLSRPPSPR